VPGHIHDQRGSAARREVEDGCVGRVPPGGGGHRCPGLPGRNAGGVVAVVGVVVEVVVVKARELPCSVRRGRA
jgi:hypothetical protein